MKITLSKSQWQEIGKKAGWSKAAQTLPEPPDQSQIEDSEEEVVTQVEGVLKEDVSSSSVSLILEVSRGSSSYRVIAKAHFEYESAQNGGMTDPSWDEGFDYSGCSITSITEIDYKGNVVNGQIDNNIKADIENCVEEFCNEKSDKYSRALMGSVEDARGDAAYDRYLDRQDQYAKSNKKITLSKAQWQMIGKKAGWLKLSNGFGRISGDLSDILEVPVIDGMRSGKSEEEIFQNIKANFSEDILSENLTDDEIKQFISGTIVVYK